MARPENMKVMMEAAKEFGAYNSKLNRQKSKP
jgi:hypothetical protein